MTAFAEVTARRQWFIPDLVVWGLPGIGEVEYLVAETVDSTTSVLVSTVNIGAGEQEILFNQLMDHRGNLLPANISAPKILIRPKSEVPVFIVGRETSISFRIARDPSVDYSVLTDLMIIETGD